MRALIISTLTALGLTGGVAAADTYHGDYHGNYYRGEGNNNYYRGEGNNYYRGGHYRDYRVRPAPRYERHVERHGYRWVGGQWRWGRGEWYWAPGYYVRINRY